MKISLSNPSLHPVAFLRQVADFRTEVHGDDDFHKAAAALWRAIADECAEDAPAVSGSARILRIAVEAAKQYLMRFVTMSQLHGELAPRLVEESNPPADEPDDEPDDGGFTSF